MGNPWSGRNWLQVWPWSEPPSELSCASWGAALLLSGFFFLSGGKRGRGSSQDSYNCSHCVRFFPPPPLPLLFLKQGRRGWARKKGQSLEQWGKAFSHRSKCERSTAWEAPPQGTKQGGLGAILPPAAWRLGCLHPKTPSSGTPPVHAETPAVKWVSQNVINWPERARPRHACHLTAPAACSCVFLGGLQTQCNVRFCMETKRNVKSGFRILFVCLEL